VVDVPISGSCDSRFRAVRDEFVHNFSERGEIGAGVCVIVDGHTVVDLVGGWTDRQRTTPWSPETLVNFYSVGKAIVALLALRLVDQGLIGLDDPVVSVWPEFGEGGKESVTVRQVLCHQAGLPAIRRPLTNSDLWQWGRMTDALAATTPWWDPGTRHTYHTNTYGHLTGEIIRRVSGETAGDQLRSLAGPLDAEVWFGVPRHLHSRCADILWHGSTDIKVDFGQLTGDELMIMLSYFNPSGYSSVGVVNTARWRSAEVPSTNGHGTARGIALLYAALIASPGLLSADLLAEATAPQSTGFCPVLGEDVTFGLGFTPTTDRRPFGPNPGSFGHFGTGGAVGFADSRSGVAFGYVMNDVIPRWQSTRNRALIAALYDSL
jgi:CubicO group peptidase (beta-lactamase class C family)